MLGSLLGTRKVGDGEERQTERLLRWIGCAAVTGIGAILLGGICETGRHGWRGFLCFCAVGLLAALLALVVGGALGLLFGLPVGSKVVVVTGAAAAAGKPAEDWFGDNNAMEQIVDWLTKIIVGLGLVQARAIADQFDRIAAATSLAMGVRSVSGDAGKVVGGTILVAYLVLGFAALFLWARRYLKREWTDERRDTRAAQEKKDRAFLEESAAQGTQQLPRIAAPEAEQLVEAARSRSETGGDFPEPVAPGGVRDDPWKGQFGGQPASDRAVLSATVRPFQHDAEMFAVTLILQGTDETTRDSLAYQAVRLYLHPTFRNPIRMLSFDKAGQTRLALLCYGSFTVGAQLADGTLLELDLSRLPDAPQLFRDR